MIPYAVADQQRFAEWANLLAEDLSYTAPLRSTRTGPDQRANVVRTTKHFDDDYTSIMGRLGRLRTKSAWAEDPPSRTRRIITNILVWRGTAPDQYEVASYLFLARSRYEYSDYQFMSAVRKDVLRRSESGTFQARTAGNHHRPVRPRHAELLRLSLKPIDVTRTFH